MAPDSMSNALAANKTIALEALKPLIEHYEIKIDNADNPYNRNLQSSVTEHAFDLARLVAYLSVIVEKQAKEIADLQRESGSGSKKK